MSNITTLGSMLTIAAKMTTFALLAVSKATSATDELDASAHMSENEKALDQSQRWKNVLENGTPGCSAAVTDAYDWRTAGYGSNVNFLLLAWANAMVEDRKDVAVVVNTEKLFPRTTCMLPSNGVETHRGWHCIFAPMSHLCAFNDYQEWAEFNRLRGLSPREQSAISDRGRIGFLYDRKPFINNFAKRSGSGTFELFAMLYEHLTSHHQPWFKSDVEAVLTEPDVAAVRAANYVSMHIRRSDKVALEASFTATEEYFKRAFDYLSTSPGGLNLSDITGLWLSTDDDEVFEEVKSLTPQYFPGVKPEAVVFVTARIPVPVETTENGPQDRNAYDAMVLLRAEMLMLAGADVFSGTFSSNLGRVVALMRETQGKPRESTLSSDVAHWFA